MYTNCQINEKKIYLFGQLNAANYYIVYSIDLVRLNKIPFIFKFINNQLSSIN